MTECTPDVVYVAAEGFVPDLLRELALRGDTVVECRERLVLARHGSAGGQRPGWPAWAQNVWEQPVWLPVRSISHAARQLQGMQRNWHCQPVHLHRRCALISQQLPHVSAKALAYGQPVPPGALGGWTLWEKDLILASPRCSSPFPGGCARFVEDKRPPSRAYLKLWEAFTLVRRHPLPGDLCVDLGASPGGWTWVLAHNHEARVFSLDRAPLAPDLERHPLVHSCRGSGFGLEPAVVGRVDWLFSDMICYPDKLWSLVERWLNAGACRNAVCTLKFQGETDHAVAARFAAVPGSRLMHLGVNRHELTWVLLDAGAPQGSYS